MSILSLSALIAAVCLGAILVITVAMLIRARRRSSRTVDPPTGLPARDAWEESARRLDD